MLMLLFYYTVQKKTKLSLYALAIKNKKKNYKINYNMNKRCRLLRFYFRFFFRQLLFH